MADEFEAQAKLSGADEFVSDAKKIKEAVEDASKAGGNGDGFEKFGKAVDEAGEKSKDASGDIESAGKKAKSSGDDASSGSGGWDKLKGALGNVASTAAGFVVGTAITKLPGFLTDAAQAAADDEAATLRLQQAVKNLGGDYDATMSSVDAAIVNGQKLAFTDDDVRDSFVMLSAATGDSNEALSRLALAQDLARGAGIPLSQASKLLGKVTDENISVFSRMGITFDKNATQADVLAAVQKKFAGQAEVYAKSTAGQWEQARISMSETIEGIGYALLPVMTEIGKGLAEIMPVVQEVVGAIAQQFSQVLIPAIRMVVDFIRNEVVPILVSMWGPFVEKLQMIAGVITGTIIPAIVEFGRVIVDRLKGPLQELFTLMGGGETTFKAAAIVIGALLTPAFIGMATAAAGAAVTVIAATLPFIAMGVAIAGLIAIVAIIINKWDEITERWPILGTVVDATKEKIAAFGSFLTDDFMPAALAAFNSVRAAVVEAWPTIQNIIVTAMKIIGEIVQAVWPVIVATVTGAMEAIQGVVQAVWPIIEQTIATSMAAIELAMAIWNRFAPIVKAAMDVIEAVIKAVWPAIQVVIGAAMTVIQGIISAGWTVISAVTSAAWSSIEGLIRGTLQIIQGVFDAFTAILEGDWQALWDALGTIVSGAWTIITGFVQAGIDLVKGAFEAGKELIKATWDAMWELIKGLVPIAFAAIVTLIQAGIGLIVGLAGEMLDAGKKLMGAMKDGLIEIWDITVAWIQTLPGLARDAIVEGVSLLFEAGKALFDSGTGLWGGMVSTFIDLLVWVGTIPGKVIAGLGDMYTKLYNYGKDAIQGFLNGLASLGESLWNAGVDAAGDFLGGFTSKLPFGSPSPLMHQYGVWSVQGFVNGAGSQSDYMYRIGQVLASQFIEGIESAQPDVVYVGTDMGEDVANALGDGWHVIITGDVTRTIDEDVQVIGDTVGPTAIETGTSIGEDIANGLGDGWHRIIIHDVTRTIDSDVQVIGDTVGPTAIEVGEDIGNSINEGIANSFTGARHWMIEDAMQTLGDWVDESAHDAIKEAYKAYKEGLTSDQEMYDLIKFFGYTGGHGGMYTGTVPEFKAPQWDKFWESIGLTQAHGINDFSWFTEKGDWAKLGFNDTNTEWTSDPWFGFVPTEWLKTAAGKKYLEMRGINPNNNPTTPGYNPYHPNADPTGSGGTWVYKNGKWTLVPRRGGSDTTEKPGTSTDGNNKDVEEKADELAEIIEAALSDNLLDIKDVLALRAGGFDEVADIVMESMAGLADMADVLSLRTMKLDALAEHLLKTMAGLEPGTSGETLAQTMAEIIGEIIGENLDISDVLNLRNAGYGEIADIVARSLAGLATISDVLLARTQGLDALAEMLAQALAGLGGSAMQAGLGYATVPYALTARSGSSMNLDLSGSNFTGTPQENAGAIETVVRRILSEEQSGLITLGVR